MVLGFKPYDREDGYRIKSIQVHRRNVRKILENIYTEDKIGEAFERNYGDRAEEKMEKIFGKKRTEELMEIYNQKNKK